MINGLRIFLRLAFFRGLAGQALFSFLGWFLVRSIRAANGMDITNHEPGIVIGALMGVIGFLICSGVTTDWIKWMIGKDAHLHHGAPEGLPEWTRYLSIDVNHKIIGIQYGISSIVIFLVGGILAIIFRLELAYPGLQFLSPDEYNTIFSAHGIIMIAAILAGVGALVNYLVPLMIGAADMAFPRLNAFSYWVSLPSAVLLMAGIVIGGWDTGWTGYPTNSTTTQMVGVQLFLLGFYVNGFASIASAINTIVTVATMRAEGMSLWRMPIFVWAAISTSLIQFTATQTVGVALLMVVTQRTLGFGFFDPTPLANGMPVGDPILFQHIFWFYSHPAVYVFILPGLGIISELLPVFARKPLFGYKPIALASLGIGLVGFIVWAHHMFTAGMPDGLRAFFMWSTLFVAIPTGVKFFSWLGTIWGGKLTFETPMLFVLGAISVFLIGGLSGPILGTIPTDLHLHDSYFVVGHFHATMFGGFVFPFFAAIYYWFPKMTGRMYNESLGKLHFWLMVPGFWVMSLGQMRAGLMGMRRRIVDYELALGVEGTQALITVAALVIGWSVLIALFNFVWSMRTADAAESNPWGSRSPEWQIPGLIPEMNYDLPIRVVGEPYDYGLNDNYIEMIPAAGD